MVTVPEVAWTRGTSPRVTIWVLHSNTYVIAALVAAIHGRVLEGVSAAGVPRSVYMRRQEPGKRKPPALADRRLFDLGR